MTLLFLGGMFLMNSLLSPKWWVSMFITTLMTMVFIYLIKLATTKVNIPFVSTMAQAV